MTIDPASKVMTVLFVFEMLIPLSLMGERRKETRHFKTQDPNKLVDVTRSFKAPAWRVNSLMTAALHVIVLVFFYSLFVKNAWRRFPIGTAAALIILNSVPVAAILAWIWKSECTRRNRQGYTQLTPE